MTNQRSILQPIQNKFKFGKRKEKRRRPHGIGKLTNFKTNASSRAQPSDQNSSLFQKVQTCIICEYNFVHDFNTIYYINIIIELAQESGTLENVDEKC